MPHQPSETAIDEGEKMQLKRHECTGAAMFPNLPLERQKEVDYLMNAARAACDAFAAHLTDGNRWVVVPEIRSDAAIDKNLITVWATSNGVSLDIRPKPKGQKADRALFSANEIHSYQQRMTELFARMQKSR